MRYVRDGDMAQFYPQSPAITAAATACLVGGSVGDRAGGSKAIGAAATLDTLSSARPCDWAVS